MLDASGIAARADLQPGDELLSVDGKVVIGQQQGTELLRLASGSTTLRVRSQPTLVEVDNEAVT